MKKQPDPVKNNNPAIVDLVVTDMLERKRVGIERYGVPLQANNGRNALVDAYEEALDLCMYLKQALEEQNNKCDYCKGHCCEDNCDPDRTE